MAVRYCGDVEAKTVAVRDGIVVRLRWPENGKVRGSDYIERGVRARPDSVGYDRIVRRAILDLLKVRPRLPVERSSWGSIVVRRVFQAPCPRHD